MSTPSKKKPTVNDFSLAFQQLAGFVAIAKTRDKYDVLDQLVQQTFVVLPEETIRSATDVNTIIDTLFGITLPENEVHSSVNRLLGSGKIVHLPAGQLGLRPSDRKELEDRISDAKRLEEHVRDAWFEATDFEPSDKNLLWGTLKKFLAHVFRRHGIHAITLLDPDSDLSVEQQTSIVGLLDDCLSEGLPITLRARAKSAITDFFDSVGADRSRAEYLVQLADGAFNYYSLVVAPEVSSALRTNVQSLVLFLDTNFVFGVLGLQSTHQDDVSLELMDTIQRLKLPFKLRYHEATRREIINTLAYFSNSLRSRRWPQAISRAVVRAGNTSGILLRYHERNADQPLEVADFLAPYDQWEVLLRDRGVDIYRAAETDQRLRERADLEADYTDFLARGGREKPYEAIQHDMAVLGLVRSLQSWGKSSIESGALVLTCDYSLYRFEYARSRSAGRARAAVLPSLLLQVLRPFVSGNDEFDRTFAQAFALPEFTLKRGGAQKAVSRVASILAGYRDIPEETATKMLSNDLLLAEIQRRNDDEAAQVVERELAREHAALIEEKAGLAIQLEKANEKNKALGDENTKAKAALDEKAKALTDKEKEIDALVREPVTHIDQPVVAVPPPVSAAKEPVQAPSSPTRMALLAASSLSGLILCIVIMIAKDWPWLDGHPRETGLWGCAGGLIVAAIFGTLAGPWRKWLWGTAVLTLIGILLQIL